MTILAMDSSGTVASVAIWQDGVIRAEYSVNHKKTHSQTLLPMIQEIVAMTETVLDDVDAIAIASGPGSFTGLRIGSATAKGLGLALKKPLIAVPTLEGLAFNYEQSEWQICPMMDARRNQVYTGVYSFVDGYKIIQDQTVVPVEEIINLVNETNKKTIFLGDGAIRYAKEIVEQAKVEYQFATCQRAQQSAASVAVRAAQLLQKGEVVSADAFKPEYLRLSQAERERNEKMAKEGK